MIHNNWNHDVHKNVGAYAENSLDKQNLQRAIRGQKKTRSSKKALI
jgi:hypothetical protein